MNDSLYPADPSGFRGLSSDPNDPPWRSPTAVAVWVLSVVMIVLVPMLLVMPYLYSRLGGMMDRDQLAEILVRDPTAVLIQALAIFPAHLITIVVAWIIVTNNRRYSFREVLGWNSGGVRWWHYVLILGGFLGLMIIVGSFVPEQDNEMLRMIKSSRSVLYTIAILSVVTAPLIEEVVYRGILYSAFQRSVGQVAAVGLVTLLFALVHVPQYWPSFSTIFLLTLLSLILTLLRVYSGNLLPSIILHTVFNGLQSLLLIAEPSLKQEPTSIGGLLRVFGAN